MLLKVIIILLVIAMLVSLFSGLYFLAKDKSDSRRTLNALTARISIWVVLFVILSIALYTGALKPSNSINPDRAIQQERIQAQPPSTQ